MKDEMPKINKEDGQTGERTEEKELQIRCRMIREIYGSAPVVENETFVNVEGGDIAGAWDIINEDQQAKNNNEIIFDDPEHTKAHTKGWTAAGGYERHYTEFSLEEIVREQELSDDDRDLE